MKLLQTSTDFLLEMAMNFFPQLLQDVVNAYLAEHLHMEEAMCMFYTIELLRMLEVLHSVGIIHGDIKPDNFLMRDIDDR